MNRGSVDPPGERAGIDGHRQRLERHRGLEKSAGQGGVTTVRGFAHGVSQRWMTLRGGVPGLALRCPPVPYEDPRHGDVLKAGRRGALAKVGERVALVERGVEGTDEAKGRTRHEGAMRKRR